MKTISNSVEKNDKTDNSIYYKDNNRKTSRIINKEEKIKPQKNNFMKRNSTPQLSKF